MEARLPRGVRMTAAARHLVEVLARNAARYGDKPAIQFVADRHSAVETVTYAELFADAERLARGLARRAAPGSRVVLMLPSGLDYLRAFWACLAARVIAVPLYPATQSESRRDRRVDRRHAVVVDAEPALVICEADREPIHRALAGAGVEVATVAEIARDADVAAAWARPAISDDDVAFLQYTSGSTGTPKGVVVRHRNLLANLDGMYRRLDASDTDDVVTWLPLFHDMGLIGAVLGPLHEGSTVHLMSPQTFMQAPSLWLELLSRHRAAISFAPNVAYEMCARLSDEFVARLDLGAWRHAVNGAEPIHAATLARFTAKMAPAGFRASAMRCGYGQAEITLCATSNGAGEEPRVVRVAKAELERHVAVDSTADDAVELVSCGTPIAGVHVVIVEPQTKTRCADGAVGEIWIAGAASCDAYWRKDEASAETLRARLSGDDRPYVRSGDLGFVRDGELIVCGRLKDLIILGGHNIYPQDVEQAVADDASLRRGRVAAFSSWDAALGREKLVIVAELARSASSDGVEAALCARMRQAVHDAIECAVDEIVLVERGSIPMTTSGKIARQAARRAHIDGVLAVRARSGAVIASDDAAPLAALRARLAAGDAPAPAYAAYLGALLGPARAASSAGDASLVQCGLDSLAIGRLRSALERDLGWAPELPALFGDATVGELAAMLAARTLREAAGGAGEVIDAPAGAGPLSHAQARLWYLHELAPSDCAHNLVARATLDGPLDADALGRAVDALVERHAILRTAYRTIEDRTEQVVMPHAGGSLQCSDLSGAAPGAQRAAIDACIVAERTTPFEPAAGRVFRAHLVRCAPDRHELVLGVHHIGFDGRSLELFLAELDALYRGAPLDADPAQVIELARAERAALDGGAVAARLAFWRDFLGGVPTTLALAGRSDAAPQPMRHRFAIAPASCDLVRSYATAAGGTLYTSLLAIYAVLLRHLSGQARFLVGTDVDGRWLPRSSGALGFFVNQLAIRCDTSDGALRELLARQARDARAAYGHQDLPFDALVSALAPERTPGRAPLFQAKLNYQPNRSEGARVGDAQLAAVEIQQTRGAFDVVLDLVHGASGLDATLLYDAGRLGTAWARRFEALWQRTLGELARWIDRPVAELLEELRRWDASVETELGEQRAAAARLDLSQARRRVRTF